MKKILLLALLLSLPALGQGFSHRSNPGDPLTAASTITSVGTANCPGTGCVTINTQAAGTMYASIAGTYAATLQFACTNDAWVTKKAVTGNQVLSTGLSSGGNFSTLAANATGDFFVPTTGFRECGVFATSFTSNTSLTIRLDADPLQLIAYVSGTPGGLPVFVSSVATSSSGSPSCGASPCTVTNAALTILVANTARKSCFLQAVDVVDLYCKRNTSGGSAASATNFDFILNAGSASKKGGGTYSCDSPGGTWSGAINCIASAASAVVDLAVTETQ